MNSANVNRHTSRSADIATDESAVALFSDDAIWRKRVPDTYEIRVGNEVYSQFRYHLIKLKDFDARAFLKSDNPLAFALMAKMDYSRQEQVRLKAEFL